MESLNAHRGWTLLLLLSAVALPEGACQRPAGVEPSIFGSALNLSVISRAKLEAFKLKMAIPSVARQYATEHFNGRDKVGCAELRSKRYISDGLCASPRPVNEVVCPDWCLEPVAVTALNASSTLGLAKHLANSYGGRRRPGGSNRTLMEKWRCVNGATKRRKVKLLCKDGTSSVVHVRVVTSCDCRKQQEKPYAGEKDMLRALIERRMEARHKLT